MKTESKPRLNKLGVPIAEYLGVPRLILISGKYGTGKDTFGDGLLHSYLVETLDLDVGHLKFAGTLKDSAAHVLGMPVEDMYSSEGKGKMIPEFGYTVGRFQQIFGDVLRRGIHPDIFVFPVHRQFKARPHQICYATDCRFKNEAILSQKEGAVIIRLNRKPELISSASVAGRDPNHISETDLDDYPHFDLVVDNNGTIEEAWSQIRNFLFGHPNPQSDSQ